ncbi:MAG: Hint domain-containing protein [Dehalococcoidales bacterium]|nr:Hint domain-containing protein [Dehalococcoidales bacterium]
MGRIILAGFSILLLAGILMAGCVPQTTSSATPLSPTPSISTSPSGNLAEPDLEYRLFASFDNIFWCDPDFYPVARPGQEQVEADQQFPSIRADTAEFTAILAHLGLPVKADYTDAEKLSIYREYKKLTYAVQMTPVNGGYQFVLRVGQGQGSTIKGTISSGGVIDVTSRETSFNTCPICLVAGTTIAAPGGPVAVERIRAGDTVWTQDPSGNRVAAEVLMTGSTPVPASFRVVSITLSDGRSVTASPGHPTAAGGRVLGDYKVGDALQGATVTGVEMAPCAGGATYDLLPSGGTGLYWANDILLHSTLSPN